VPGGAGTETSLPVTTLKIRSIWHGPSGEQPVP